MYLKPWKAPLEIQEKANCMIGKDYPYPIVNHEDAYRENQEKLMRFFNYDKSEIFEEFLTDKTVLKPSNVEEFHDFLYSLYLNS